MGTRMLYPLLALIILGYTSTEMSRLQDEGRVLGIRWKGLYILGWAFRDFNVHDIFSPIK